jgi:hypothetical protein
MNPTIRGLAPVVECRVDRGGGKFSSIRDGGDATGGGRNGQREFEACAVKWLHIPGTVSSAKNVQLVLAGLIRFIRARDDTLPVGCQARADARNRAD